MYRSILLTLAAAFSLAVPALAGPHGDCHVCRGYNPWNTGYYNPAWGAPVALVVPPTAEQQTHYGWGVGNTRITYICPQFGRNYPGPGYYDSRGYRPTPPWPSDTDQMGINYVRGPWR